MTSSPRRWSDDIITRRHHLHLPRSELRSRPRLHQDCSPSSSAPLCSSSSSAPLYSSSSALPLPLLLSAAPLVLGASPQQCSLSNSPTTFCALSFSPLLSLLPPRSSIWGGGLFPPCSTQDAPPPPPLPPSVLSFLSLSLRTLLSLTSWKFSLSSDSTLHPQENKA